MTIELRAGNASGKTGMQVSLNEQSLTGLCLPNPQMSFSLADVAVTGGPSALTFSGTSQGGAGGTTFTMVFNGTLSGNTISGTARLSIVQQGSGGTSASGSGSTTLQVTLQK